MEDTPNLISFFCFFSDSHRISRLAGAASRRKIHHTSCELGSWQRASCSAQRRNSTLAMAAEPVRKMRYNGSNSALSRLDEDATASEADLKVPEKQASAEELRSSMKPAGGFTLNSFGDSGVWPGMARATGAIAFITPMTGLYILVWYVSGAFTNSSSKQALSQAVKEGHTGLGGGPAFLSLTLMQHLSASLCGTFALRVLKLRQHKPLPESAQTWGFYRLICVYTLGFCMTNGSFGKVNSSFVDTVKAGEPIATVILTILLIPTERVTAGTSSRCRRSSAASASSLSEASFNLLGFGMAMSSNLCFSARSICAKLLRSSLGREMDNANLFVYVNLYGALALFPVALYFDGPVLLDVLSASGGARKLFLLNGVCYYLNNQMNFLVLEKVDAVTHGLINCGRRVANIGFAIVWFRIPVTLFNGIGMSLALFGAYCYMRAKQALSKTPPPSPAPGFNRKTL